MIATIHRVAEALETVVEPEVAAWIALVGLTAGEGLAFNRAFVLTTRNDRLEGWFGIGPRSREEAAAVWGELRQREVQPLEHLARPDLATMEAERTRHAETLTRLTCPVTACGLAITRAFIGRGNHTAACVRHWVDVLGSEALAVLPMMAEHGPRGVVLADNFVTRAPISAATLEAAQTLVHSLRAALDRTSLVKNLQEEQRRSLAAEHATTLLETARTLAHDLKNPLAIAGGLARELLADPPPTGEALFKRLTVIANAVRVTEERLAELADGLTAQVTKVTLVPIDVGAIVERVVDAFRPLAQHHHERLVFYRPGRELRGDGEPSWLERCVENLVGNAIHALQHGLAPSPMVRVAVFAEREHVRVEVADNGPPPPSVVRHDPFLGSLTPRRPGTGLGLVSVRRLVEAMGGRVEYDENEPGWVRFTLFLRRSS